MRSYTYSAGGNGREPKATFPIPNKEAATAAHEALVEMIAEGNDELMEEFFATGTLPGRAHHQRPPAGRPRTRAFSLCSVLPPRPNIGIDLLLNFIAEDLSFAARRVRKFLPSKTAGDRAKRSRRTKPPSIFVFKTAADPFAGASDLLQSDVGRLKDDAHLINQRSNYQRASGAHRHAFRKDHASRLPNCVPAISA